VRRRRPAARARTSAG